ncbi:MAG TPA: glycosyltransferase family 4 protein [Rhizomicrobium sp.]|nr:glycosyltransferase family 4 protein [Rhizomicrobium sp.]
MRKYSIIVINDHGSVAGGDSKIAIDSAAGLARRGYDVTYFCSVPPVEERLRAAGVRVVCTDQSASANNASQARGALQNLWNAASQRKLSQLLAEADPRKTIVHVHGWTKALSPSCLWAIRRSNLATVFAVHDYFLACPNGGLFNYQTQQPCSLKPMSRSCLTSHCDKHSHGMKLFRVVRQILQDQAISRPSAPWHFAAVSDFCLDKISTYLPAGIRRSVIPNPVDLEKLPPSNPGVSDQFVGVGRLSPEKGFASFATAARLAGVAATIIGKGEAREEIVAANPAVELPGWLGHSDMLNRLRKARALVFPSLWPETLGLSPLEAAAQGIPSVISDNVGVREWILDGVNGLHFPAGNVDALSACLTRLKDDDLVNRLGQCAYDRYWANAPTLDKHVDRLEILYDDLLGQIG